MTGTLSFIHWRDASMNYGPTETREQVGLLDLYEFGLIFVETPDSVTLTMEGDESMDTTRIRLSIPKVNIVERQDVPLADFLRWARKRKKRVTKGENDPARTKQEHPQV